LRQFWFAVPFCFFQLGAPVAQTAETDIDKDADGQTRILCLLCLVRFTVSQWAQFAVIS